jgi:predicted secreted protein
MIRNVLLLTVIVAVAMAADFNESVRAGKTYSIPLRGNPTTGYGWFASVVDSSIVTITNVNSNGGSKDYVTDPAPAGFAGVGGTYYFTVLGLRAGKTTITFQYKRPWETTSSKVENHVVTVTQAGNTLFKRHKLRLKNNWKW